MRDYVHYNYKKKRQRRDGKITLWVLGFVFSLLGFILAVYYFYSQPDLSVANLKNEAVTKITSYFPQVFQKQKKTLPVKKMAVAIEVEKPLHFDFYDELPKARLELPQKIDSQVASTTASVSKPAPAATPISAPMPEVASISEEKNITANLDSGIYILQIGIFHNVEAANRYHSALLSVGFKVDIVRVKEGNEVIYRLQQGPYHGLEQLRLAKKKMAGRGIICEVKKIAS